MYSSGEKNNYGFSLVELIIAIAIMAILIGISVPTLIRYIEKTNVSADIQLCDSVREAIIIASNDPSVLSSDDLSKQMIENIYNPDPYTGKKIQTLSTYSGDWLDCEFCEEVEGILGFNPFDIKGDVTQYMKSSPANAEGGLMTCVNEDNTDFAIFIQNSDRTGNKNKYQYFNGKEGLKNSKVIYAE